MLQNLLQILIEAIKSFNYVRLYKFNQGRRSVITASSRASALAFAIYHCVIYWALSVLQPLASRPDLSYPQPRLRDHQIKTANADVNNSRGGTIQWYHYGRTIEIANSNECIFRNDEKEEQLNPRAEFR